MAAPIRVDADGVVVEGRRSKAGHHRGKTEEGRNDRRPHSNMKNRGRPKKGGGGGKGTWGKPGMDDLYEADVAFDEGDLNYEEEDNEPYVLVSRYDRESSKASRVGVPLSSAGRLGYDTSVVGSPPRDYSGAAAPPEGVERQTLSSFKKRIIPVIAEYFDSGDIEEVSRAVLELHAHFFHYELVKRAITMSLEKSDRERELVSRLISTLYPKLLPMSSIGKAFERLFELADDLQLDNPDAFKLIAQFLGRAVVDEVLPPSFLSDRMVEDLGGEIVREARTLLSIRHGSERLERVWGAAAGETSELKTAIRMLVKEYFLSLDAAEAARCVRELSVPHFHHEVVKRTLVVAMDQGASTQAVASDLLKYLHKQGVVSSAQMAIGFQRVKNELADISLDQPHAPEMFEAFITAAKASECLEAEWIAAEATTEEAVAAVEAEAAVAAAEEE